jgi:hypothetical protein
VAIPAQVVALTAVVAVAYSRGKVQQSITIIQKIGTTNLPLHYKMSMKKGAGK